MTQMSTVCSTLSSYEYNNIKECCLNDDDCRKREYRWIFNEIHKKINKINNNYKKYTEIYTDTKIIINCYPIKKLSGYCDLIICIFTNNSSRKQCIPIECHSDKDGHIGQLCNSTQIKKEINRFIRRIDYFLEFFKKKEELHKEKRHSHALEISAFKQYYNNILEIYSKCFDHKGQKKTESIEKCMSLIDCIENSESFPGIIVNPYNNNKLNNRIPYHKFIYKLLEFFFSSFESARKG